MVVPYEQRNLATLWNSQPFTAFIMSFFRRLHEYSGPTSHLAPESGQKSCPYVAQTMPNVAPMLPISGQPVFITNRFKTSYWWRRRQSHCLLNQWFKMLNVQNAPANTPRRRDRNSDAWLASELTHLPWKFAVHCSAPPCVRVGSPPRRDSSAPDSFKGIASFIG